MADVDNQLDATQYTTTSIRKYESIYGKDFVSPGGRGSALALSARLSIKPGERVLDAGCGLGGSAFLMATEYGARVDGIDLSANMIAIATARVLELGLAEQVHLWHGDCLELTGVDTYDAIYSRDVFLHIHDKERLFTTLHRLLRRGGRLLFTDYCCGPRPWSEDFGTYVQQRGYCLHTIEDYSAIVAEAGFRNVHAEDRTEEFISTLTTEFERISQLALGESERHAMQTDWQSKIGRAKNGEQRWGLLEAVK